MVRKTKEDALATRERILDTAEEVFWAHGVSRTSLQAIAQAAGLTRGAIYWHFKNKSDLFQALMQRITLPLFARLDAHSAQNDVPPLQRICDNMRWGLRLTARNTQMRRIFEIASFKLEYVGDMLPLHQQHRQDRARCMRDTRQLLEQASAQGGLRSGVDVEAAVVGLDALIAGLLRNWLLDPAGFDLETVGLKAVEQYLSGLTPAPFTAAIQ